MLFQPHDGVNINHRMFANYVEARWYCAKVRMVNFMGALLIQSAKGQEKKEVLRRKILSLVKNLSNLMRKKMPSLVKALSTLIRMIVQNVEAS